MVLDRKQGVPLALGVALLIALVVLGCQTEVPTWGKEVWGRNEGELEVIPIGSTLSEIAVDPDRPYLYLADFDGNRLYFISRATHQLEREMVVGPRPADLAFSMDGTRLYVTLAGGSQIAVVDLDRQALIASVPLSFSPAYLVVGRPPYLYAASVLEIWRGFTPQGDAYLVDTATRTETVLPQMRLLEIDPLRRRLYAANNREILRYSIGANGGVQAESQLNAEGQVVELQLNDDGTRLYTISAGSLFTPEMVVSRGLIDSRKNVEVDMVEVFATDPLTKVGELYTGAFPRAVAHSGEYLVVAAADSASASRPGGFAILYDQTTLESLATYRLAGAPTGCAVVDSATGLFYVAIDNPYDIRERFGERQDLQVVPLRRPGPVQEEQ